MSAQAIGWDLHRKFSKVSLQQRSDSGEVCVMERARLDHFDRVGMRKWLARMEPGTPVAMEGSFGWPWVADLLEELGLEPHLGHPPAIQVLCKHEAKADRCDADRLARLWLRGIFPESYLAPPEVRQLRERIRYRMQLVAVQTGIKNRVHAVLHRWGLLHEHSDLFGKAGRAFLEALDVPPAVQMVLDGWLAVLDLLRQEIAAVEAWMTQNLQEDDIVRRLKTLPGVGPILAHVLRSELGEIDRFAGYRKLVRYAGLAPMSDDSADRHGRRHLSPACNHTLRWAFIEAATGAIHRKGPSRLHRLYHRISRGGTTDKGQAKAAVARELAKLAWLVWKKGEDYTETPPSRPGSKMTQIKTKRTSVRSD
jgi:transposase